MMNASGQINGPQQQSSYIDIAIRIAFIGLIAVWCFKIFSPFITIIAWSMIIAVAAYPFVLKMSGWFGGRRKIAIIVFVAISLLIILLPGILLTGSIVHTGKELMEGVENSTLTIHSPDISVRDWPLVGEKFYQIWTEASTQLEDFLKQYTVQVKAALGWLFKSLATIGIDVVVTLVAIILAGILMGYADGAYKSMVSFFGRIFGRNGKDFADSSRDTIRSVVQGVVLVAVIQAVLAWVGMTLAHVPAAGVWAIIVLILAIMQLPPILILLPMIIYVFSEASSGLAIVFMIWSILVSISDSFLKPMFLGRGLKIPMLIILIGAIGGMILHGIVGLFIGAVVMSLGYQIYMSWLHHWQFEEPDEVISSGA